jgi:hypothetical protein
LFDALQLAAYSCVLALILTLEWAETRIAAVFKQERFSSFAKKACGFSAAPMKGSYGRMTILHLKET